MLFEILLNFIDIYLKKKLFSFYFLEIKTKLYVLLLVQKIQTIKIYKFYFSDPVSG